MKSKVQKLLVLRCRYYTFNLREKLMKKQHCHFFALFASHTHTIPLLGVEFDEGNLGKYQKHITDISRNKEKHEVFSGDFPINEQMDYTLSNMNNEMK